jgi:hypothetical protein
VTDMNELNHHIDKTIKGEIESMIYLCKKILAIKVYRRAAFMGLNGMTVWFFSGISREAGPV